MTAGGVSSSSDSLALVETGMPSSLFILSPIARTTSLGFSAVMMSLISVPVIALLTSARRCRATSRGVLGAISGSAIENCPGRTFAVCPPDLKATHPCFPIFTTPVVPGGKFERPSSSQTTKYVPRAATSAVAV
jgi:hypothetical protein